MVVKSLHKRQVNMIIKLKSKNNSTHIIEKKITYVKYLGVFIRLFYGKPCILYFFHISYIAKCVRELLLNK